MSVLGKTTLLLSGGGGVRINVFISDRGGGGGGLSLHISGICIFPRYLPPRVYVITGRGGKFSPGSTAFAFVRRCLSPDRSGAPAPGGAPSSVGRLHPPLPRTAPPRYHFGKLYPRLWIHIRAGRCAWLLPPRRARLILMHYSPPASYMHIQHRGGNLQLQERSENSQEMRERRGRAERVWII